MSEIEYTPGPWEARYLLPDRHVIRRPGTYEIRTPAWDVATYIEHGGPIRREADAALIQASPDLLVACEIGDDVLDGPGLLRSAARLLERNQLISEALLRKAAIEEAAIAKARSRIDG